MKPTAANYRAARIARGLNRSQLAEALGVWRETISRRESGALPITREHMLAISALPLKTAATSGRNYFS